MREYDTIAAVATGMGSAGIGIIRVSGPAAVSAVSSILVSNPSLEEADSHMVLYGHIVFDGKEIDEVLVTKFLSPRSYTREDVVEISSHGGSFVMQRILEAVFLCGARPAEPGEFTKRAFLNGRIDLAQAESVMDIISSDNERMLSNSLRQLDGALSDKIRSLRDILLHETAFIEAALDDPEHYDLSNYPSILSKKLKDIRNKLKEMIVSSEQGRILRDGIRTAIVGKPNAGKSSLLNALAKADRAIVTDIPGTTRDTIEEKVRFYDMVLSLCDTAGIRNTENPVEKIGVERSLEALESADLILYVMDLAEAFSSEDILILDKLDFKKVIPLLNKQDLAGDQADTSYVKKGRKFLVEHGFSIEWLDRWVCISAKEQKGFEALADRIRNVISVGSVDNSVDILITNARHAHLLRAADVSLSLVEKSINESLPEDFFTVDLMDAYAALGEIIGEEVEDDLVDKVFRDFCMGK